MPIEIELKARVNKPEELKIRLSKLGSLHCTFEKDDVYWAFPDDAGVKLRVRHESKTNARGKTSKAVLVTCKTREIREGIEINEEKELSISDIGTFEDILKYLGLEPGIRKKKLGSAWKCHAGGESAPILAELSEVKGLGNGLSNCLGYFIELEIISGVRDEQNMAKNRKLLLDLLEKLDIPREMIEARPYTEMLKELGAGD